MLLGISGSLRRDSHNRKLIREAGRIYGTDDFIEADIRFPLFDADLQAEHGIPEVVKTLVAQIEAAEAVIISTPEYNKALSGVLKNALDWVSRAEGNPWRDTPVAIMSATAGRSGGERAQNSLRLVISPFGPKLLTGREVLIAQAKDQFDADGRLSNDRYRAALETQRADLKKLVGQF